MFVTNTSQKPFAQRVREPIDQRLIVTQIGTNGDKI